MNVENRNTNRKTWNEGDTSPYDFKEMEMPRNNQRNNYRPYDTYIPQEDELDMRAVRDSFDHYDRSPTPQNLYISLTTG